MLRGMLVQSESVMRAAPGNRGVTSWRLPYHSLHSILLQCIELRGQVCFAHCKNDPYTVIPILQTSDDAPVSRQVYAPIAGRKASASTSCWHVPTTIVHPTDPSPLKPQPGHLDYWH